MKIKFIIKEYDDIKEKIDNMSIRDLVDTVCVPHLAPFEKEKVYKSEVVFFHPGTPEQVEEKKEQLKEYKGKVPLITADFECGCGDIISGSVKFPSLYSFGKINDAETVYKIGRATGEEGRRHGYAWTFGPCVDILLEKESPMASLRTAGESVDKVIETCGAYMRGLQDSGLVATLKHFPGEGATTYDQHLTTVENPLSFDEWKESYGKIYKTLIDDGVMAVMPGHIALPSYDEPDENGLYPPATLSYKLMTELLKNEFGFDGIIVSDAINMGGCLGYMNYYKACAKFLECGGDLLLFVNPDERLYTKFEEFIADGTLSLALLKNRAYRVCCFAKYLEEEFKPNPTTDVDMRKLEEYVVKNSVEVVRDRQNVLPFKLTDKTRILHTVIMNDYGKGPYKQLDEKLKSISNNVTTLIDVGCDRLREEVESGKYDLVICSCGCLMSFGTNVVRLHGSVARNMMHGWMRFDTPVVFVNYANPYLCDEYKYAMDTIINTYGVSDSTADVVTDIIFGK